MQDLINAFEADKPISSSILSRLQQKEFFKNYQGKYIAKQVGGNVIIYKKSAHKGIKDKGTQNTTKAILSNKFNGNLSLRSQKKIIQIAQNWSDTIEFHNFNKRAQGFRSNKQLVLLTLTLSKTQKHSDHFIKRHLLGGFITKMVRHTPDTSYLWKAETQKNGNIHFHLLIDNYFPKEWIQKEWNSTQSLYGYHSKSALVGSGCGMPSTKIEGLRNKDNAVSYVAKYISKNEDSRLIEGRLWGCDSMLRELVPLVHGIDKSNINHVIMNLAIDEDSFIVLDECAIIKKCPAGILKEFTYVDSYEYRTAVEMNMQAYERADKSPLNRLKNTEWYKDVEKEFERIKTYSDGFQSTLFETQGGLER